MISSRFGKRFQLMTGLVIMCVGMAGMAFFQDYISLMATRALMGLGHGLFVATSYAMADRLADKGHEGQAMGDVALGFSAAYVLGIPIGRFIADFMGWHAIYVCLACFACILIPVIARCMPKTPGVAVLSFLDQIAPLRKPRIVVALSMTFLTFVAFSLFNSYITPYLNGFVSDNTSLVSCILLLVGLMSVIGTRAGGHFADKRGAHITIIAGLVLQIIPFIFLCGLFPPLAIVVVLLCIWMTARWSFLPAQNLNLVQLAPEQPTVVIGLSNSFLQLGNAAGSALGGLVVAQVSVNALVEFNIGINIVCLIVGIVLFAFVDGWKRHSHYASSHGSKLG